MSERNQASTRLYVFVTDCRPLLFPVRYLVCFKSFKCVGREKWPVTITYILYLVRSEAREQDKLVNLLRCWCSLGVVCLWRCVLSENVALVFLSRTVHMWSLWHPVPVLQQPDGAHAVPCRWVCLERDTARTQRETVPQCLWVMQRWQCSDNLECMHIYAHACAHTDRFLCKWVIMLC